MPPTTERYIVFDNASMSPLGQVKMAGSFRESAGVRKPRRLGYYALVYVTGGHGYFRDGLGFSCTLKPGDLLLLFPEVEHAYGPIAGATWDETFIVFEGSAFDLWREEGLLNPKKPLYSLEPVEHWHGRIISAVWNEPGSGTDAALSRVCHLQELLADIITFENRRNGTATSWLGGAVRRLEEAVHAAPDYGEIANELGMTYEGFRKRFAREAGISPGRATLRSYGCSGPAR